MMELRVKVVAMDHDQNYMVLLTDFAEKKVLPIWVGPFEAHAIAMPLRQEEPERPLTHDLLFSCCQKLDGKVEKIIISDISAEGTYFAEIHILYQGKLKIIDSRPSDAIALALRCKVPIYMALKLVEFTLDYDNIAFEKPDDEKLH